MKLRINLTFRSARNASNAVLSLVLIAAVGLSVSGNAADLVTQAATKTRRAATLAQFHCTQAGNRLVTVGERGSVLLSDDSGRTLRQAEVDTAVTLTHVHFQTSQRGWAVGHAGVVLETQDGGEHWKRLLDGNAAARLELEAAKGAGNAKRLAEAEQLVNEGADKPFLSVLFKNTSLGWAIGSYGLIFETQDGGKTWNSVMGRVEAAKGRHLYAILIDGDDLWLAGEQGLMLHSADGGIHFASIESPSKGTLFGLLKGEGKTLIAYGLKGHVYRTVDRGRHWTSIPMPPISLTTGMALDDGNLVLGSEAGQLFVSQNDGKSFDLFAQNSPSPTASLTVAHDGAVVRCGMEGVERLAAIHRDVKQ